jgi:hypothetical protein
MIEKVFKIDGYLPHKPESPNLLNVCATGENIEVLLKGLSDTLSLTKNLYPDDYKEHMIYVVLCGTLDVD